MPQIKIVHIINDLEIGGAQKVVCSIVENLNHKRFVPYVLLVAGKGEGIQKLLEKNIPVLYFSCISRTFLLKFPNPIQILRLSLWLKNNKISIIHTHLFLGGTIGRLAAILAGVPIIFHTEHNTYYWKKSYHVWIDRSLSVFTKKIISVSQAVKDFTIKQEKIPKEKFVVIYNGIDDKEFSMIKYKNRIREEFKISPQIDIVGSIGRLVPQKGYEYFFYAAKEVKQKVRSVKFLLAGDGPLRSNLEELVKKMELSEDVVFTGFRRDLVEVIGAMDIFVLPSLYEGFGFSFVEALAMDKPVVATNVGPVPEIIKHNITGKLVPVKDFHTMAKEIIFLLKNKEMAQRLGRKGGEFVREKFTLKEMIKKTESLYNEYITSLFHEEPIRNN